MILLVAIRCINGVSEEIEQIYETYGIKRVHKPINKLSQILMLSKHRSLKNIDHWTK